MFIRNKEIIARFDQGYSEKNSQPSNPVLPYYQAWEVDVRKQKWLSFYVDGFATAKLTHKPQPMASTLFGSCIPIVVDWENQESGNNFVTIMHQAGYRANDEVGQLRFTILDQFLSQMPVHFKINRCHTIRIDSIHPQVSNTEDILANLHSVLARIVETSTNQVDDIIIPRIFGYFDVVFQNNVITVYDRSNATLKQDVIVY